MLALHEVANGAVVESQSVVAEVTQAVDEVRQIEDLYRKLDDMRFNLLAFGQSPDAAAMPAELCDLLRVHLIAACPQNDAELARANIPQSSFYLLRPDGHVGLCGAELKTSEIVRYLHERAGLVVRSERPTGTRNGMSFGNAHNLPEPVRL